MQPYHSNYGFTRTYICHSSLISWCHFLSMKQTRQLPRAKIEKSRPHVKWHTKEWKHPILKQSALRLRTALRWQELTTICVRMHVKFKYSEGRQSKQHNNQMGGDIIPIKTCTLGTRYTQSMWHWHEVAFGSSSTQSSRIQQSLNVLRRQQKMRLYTHETNVFLESASSTNDNHSSQRSKRQCSRRRSIRLNERR